MTPGSRDTTWERVVPGATPEDLMHEHRMRYAFAAGYVRGKTVLDIACGAGYGSRMLLEGGAERVTAVDLFPDAIGFARKTYGTRGIDFVTADAECFRGGTHDVIVSFETLEHLEKRRSFLLNLRAMLEPGGRLILSTPNKSVTTPLKRPGSFSNRHHQHEYTERELLEDLGTAGFGSFELFGQHLFPPIYRNQLFSKLTRRRKRHKDPESRVLPLAGGTARYLVVVASGR